MIIAIDGPAGSGKGTLARRLADHFGLPYLDSGSLYRAVAAAVLAAGGDPGDEAAALAAARTLKPEAVEPGILRARRTGEAASIVAAIPAVRAALLDFQRDFAKAGAVVDGRDIATVVLPHADAKIFVTAALEERARRRASELEGLGMPADIAAVQADLAARDRRDTDRKVAPMRIADDALLLDTTDLDIEAAFQAALKLIDSRLDTVVRNGS